MLILGVKLQISCNIFEALMLSSFRTSIKACYAKSECFQYRYAFSERHLIRSSLPALVLNIMHGAESGLCVLRRALL